MRRRDFMAGSAATAAVGVAGWPVYAEINAESPIAKRIALISASMTRDRWTSTKRSKAYFQELNRLGYIEGQNLIVEWYSVLGQHDSTEDIARAVVASSPDLIVPFSGTVTTALKPLTTTIPILTITADPGAMSRGVVTSLAKPGANITGVSGAGLEIFGKRLQFLAETAQGWRMCDSS